MHEAENVLTNEQWWLFVEFLTEIRGGGVAICISATAAQRAEAFLKTLNQQNNATTTNTRRQPSHLWCIACDPNKPIVGKQSDPSRGSGVGEGVDPRSGCKQTK
jgi:hypothetical protein